MITIIIITSIAASISTVRAWNPMKGKHLVFCLIIFHTTTLLVDDDEGAENGSGGWWMAGYSTQNKIKDMHDEVKKLFYANNTRLFHGARLDRSQARCDSNCSNRRQVVGALAEKFAWKI